MALCDDLEGQGGGGQEGLGGKEYIYINVCVCVCMCVYIYTHTDLHTTDLHRCMHPTGDQSWVFIGRTDAEAETPVLWPPHVKS